MSRTYIVTTGPQSLPMPEDGTAMAVLTDEDLEAIQWMIFSTSGNQYARLINVAHALLPKENTRTVTNILAEPHTEPHLTKIVIRAFLMLRLQGRI